MKFAFITVNFNGAEDTIRLVESFKNQRESDCKLFVVDNASESRDRNKLKEYLRSQISWSELIENNENLGFSGGNNVGIRKALKEQFDWIILINNDAWVGPKFVLGLKTFLSRQDSQIVCLPIKEGAKIAYCGKVSWLYAQGFHVYDPVESLKLKAGNSLYAIGAGMAVHGSVFERIGFFDERFFLYFEDADFSVRALRADISIEIAPYAVHHQPFSTTGKLGKSKLLYYHVRNALLFNQKNAPWWVKIILPFASFYGIVLQIAKIILGINPGESRAVLRGILDFYRGRFGKIND